MSSWVSLAFVGFLAGGLDMPQPIRFTCEVKFEGLSTLPQHAEWLGHIVTLASSIDSNLGYLLAYLSRSSASVAIPMFHAVVSADAQRAMLMAAAEQQLAGAELEEFRELMEDFRTRARERNRLVHNIWAWSPQHPGKALWCHAKDYSRMPLRFAALQNSDELPLFQQTLDTMWQYCSTYTVKDLQDVYQRLRQYNERTSEFVGKLLAEHPALKPGVPISPPDNAPQIG
jgi:hypothetical protein